MNWRSTRPAGAIGAAACLRKTDWLFPQYREIGAFLVRGITGAQMGALWRGNLHGGLGFAAKCVAPISIPIGTQPLHAAQVPSLVRASNT